MPNHNITGENIFVLDSGWMNMLRGLAMSLVVIHHWLLYISYKSSTSIYFQFAQILQTIGGTAVHLFFILSGCGLTISYFKRKRFSWKLYAMGRFMKIIVPFWIIVTLTFILVNLLNFISSQTFESSYSWLSLLTYLTFTRNFFSTAWDLNPTLWFMPVILGLYLLFPFLVKVLEKYGAFTLLAMSVIITYSSITLCMVSGYTVSHQTALFLFYVIEFSFGMFIGHLMYFHRPQFNRLLNPQMFCLGIGIYCISWAMIRHWSVGGAYNDIFTGIGMFLVTLNMCQWMIRFSPKRSVNLLNQVSKESYMMYLIHGPLILFVVRPLFTAGEKLPLHPLIAVVLSILFCVVVFILARLISPLINSLGSRLYMMAYKQGKGVRREEIIVQSSRAKGAR